MKADVTLFLSRRFYALISEERGKEAEREGETRPPLARAPTGDMLAAWVCALTGGVGAPDLSLGGGTMPSPLSHTDGGLRYSYYDVARMRTDGTPGLHVGLEPLQEWPPQQLRKGP